MCVCVLCICICTPSERVESFFFSNKLMSASKKKGKNGQKILGKKRACVNPTGYITTFICKKKPISDTRPD